MNKSPRYLDDLNLADLTDDQREELAKLYESDPYYFYSLWRDPAQAQIWAEGEGFKTTPVNDLFAKTGALRLAGAPEHVIEYWRDVLEHHNRDSEDKSLFPPKTKPVPERLQQIEELVKYLDSLLNYTEDNLTPDNEDFPDDVPFAGKWLKLMNRVMGDLVTEHHDGTVRHYKETEDCVDANMGVEVVEVVLNPGADVKIDIDEWANDYIKPSACEISGDETGTLIKFLFFDCYE